MQDPRKHRGTFVILAGLVIMCVTFSAAPGHSEEIEPVDRGEQYYSVHPDPRDCIAPLCGGAFISAVNRTWTRCADGSVEKACYVASIDWRAIGLDGSEGASLVRGRQVARTFTEFGVLGVLQPSAAWRAAGLHPPEGTWFGLSDNGIQCITFPCFNIAERVLNRKRQTTISHVDLKPVEASVEDLEAAYEALAHDELIAVGKNVRQRKRGPAGRGMTMVASQFYVRLWGTSDEPYDPRFCVTTDDCTLTPFTAFVADPEACYCPICPEPLNARAALENEHSWKERCSDAPLACIQIVCIQPRPVQCVRNQCVVGDTQ